MKKKMKLGMIRIIFAVFIIILVNDVSRAQYDIETYKNLKCKIQELDQRAKEAIRKAQNTMLNLSAEERANLMERGQALSKQRSKLFAEIGKNTPDWKKYVSIPKFKNKEECVLYKSNLKEKIRVARIQYLDLWRSQASTKVNLEERISILCEYEKKGADNNILFNMLPLCDCDNMIYGESVAVNYDDRGRRIYSKGDRIFIEGDIGNITVDVGEVYYDRDNLQIEVPPGSKAHVVYTADQTRFNIQEDSQVKFTDKNQLWINKGSLAFRVHKKESKFLIKTPSAIAGCFSRSRVGAPPVPGPGFNGHQAPPLNPNDDENEFDVKVSGSKTDIIVYKGQVFVSNNVSEKSIHAGEMTTASSLEEQIIVKSIDSNKPSNTLPNRNNNNANKSRAFITGNGWSAEKTTTNKTSLQNDITSAVNNGKTPAGIYVGDNGEVDLYYINDNPLGMTAWNLEWYDGVETLQNGINTNLDQGYFPMGISFTEKGQFYVLYIMSQLQATAWQLVESELDLGVVSENIQPYINEKYIPVGITVFGGMYYTLLAQVPDSEPANWTIEGYENNNNAIKQGINNMVNQGLVPFGYLKEQDVVNVLYLGF